MTSIHRRKHVTGVRHVDIVNPIQCYNTNITPPPATHTHVCFCVFCVDENEVNERWFKFLCVPRTQSSKNSSLEEDNRRLLLSSELCRAFRYCLESNKIKFRHMFPYMELVQWHNIKKIAMLFVRFFGKKCFIFTQDLHMKCFQMIKSWLYVFMSFLYITSHFSSMYRDPSVHWCIQRLCLKDLRYRLTPLVLRKHKCT